MVCYKANNLSKVTFWLPMLHCTSITRNNDILLLVFKTPIYCHVFFVRHGIAFLYNFTKLCIV